MALRLPPPRRSGNPPARPTGAPARDALSLWRRFPKSGGTRLLAGTQSARPQAPGRAAACYAAPAWRRRFGALALSAGLVAGMAAGSTAAPGAACADDGSLVNWTRTYGSMGTSSTAYDNIADAELMVDGGYVVAGTFDGSGTATHDQAQGRADGMVARYSAEGELEWDTLVGGSAADAFNSLVVANDGGYIAVGRSQSDDGDLAEAGNASASATSVTNDALLAKFSADGTLEKVLTWEGSNADEFISIENALDGGYIAVGYTQSTDGDAAALGKTTTDRDALIVKYDENLEVEWANIAGGTGSVLVQDSFASVAPSPQGGYLAVGFAASQDGDLEGIARGEDDAFAVKFSDTGEKEWVKTFGGSDDDEFTAVARAHNKDVPADRTDITVPDIDDGFILAGTTSSSDGTFANEKSADTDGVASPFLLKLSPSGEIEWTNVLESSEDAEGSALLAVEDGYLLAGICSVADRDFTGQTLAGGDDVYLAHFTADGAYLAMSTFGGSANEIVNGVVAGQSDDYIAYGMTRSIDGPFEGLTSGARDGYLVSLDKATVDAYATERYLVPVQAWRADADTASMMAPLLFENAYVEKTGELLTVTFYFVNADIMGTQVSPSSLGAVTYDSNDAMVPAETDQYDPSTQVKTVSIAAESLEEPIIVNVEGYANFRLAFDTASQTPTDTPPYFPPVTVDQPDFAVDWKTMVGGTNYDYANDAATLASGNLLVGGQTSSNDGDFEGGLKGGASAFLAEYTPAGQLARTLTLGGIQAGSSSYVASISPASDGGFFIGGGYQEYDGVAPTGDFAALASEDSVHGLIDGFVARYDANFNLVWMSNFSGSQYDQIKQVRATADGGCVALVETSSTDGDVDVSAATDGAFGNYDLVVVKYDATGAQQWQRMISGNNLESTDFGIDVRADGSFVVAGYSNSGSGDFAETDYFGGGYDFDLFVATISADGQLTWIKTYGGSNVDYLNQVIATDDGGFLLVGDTRSTDYAFANTGRGYQNAFVLKCAADGSIEWSQVIASSDNSEARRVVELDDRFAVLGDSRGSNMDFADLNKGSMDCFVAMFDKQGNRMSLETIGGSLEDYSSQIVALNDHQLAALAYTNSNDGDFAGQLRGATDGALLAFSWREQPAQLDTSQLEGAIADAEQALASLSAGDYTPDSWSLLQQRLAEAREVLADANAEQSDVDEAALALRAAIEGLTPAPDDPDDGNDGDGDGSGDPDEGDPDGNPDGNGDPDDGTGPDEGTGSDDGEGSDDANATPGAGNDSGKGASGGLVRTGDPLAAVATGALVAGVAAAVVGTNAVKRRILKQR